MQKKAEFRLKNLLEGLYFLIMKNRDILLIADSHLKEHCPEWNVFRSLLEKISETDYDVLFLGDIFDVWIAVPGFETTIHRTFMEWCLREKKKRNLWFLEGNHEFFIKRNRAEYFTEVFPENVLLDNGAFYAVHGDTVNHHDFGYLFLRAVLRNAATYFLLRLFGFTGLGSGLSGHIRKDLQGIDHEQRHYFPRREFQALSDILKTRGIHYGVAGHFHCTGEAGVFRIIQNFSAPDFVAGVYESGKGVRCVSIFDLFGDLKS